MVGSMDIYKSLNINIGTVTKNPEMLKFVSDHRKTKKMCKHAVKSYLVYEDMCLINIRLNKCRVYSRPMLHLTIKRCPFLLKSCKALF